jgi:hypothetical protein
MKDPFADIVNGQNNSDPFADIVASHQQQSVPMSQATSLPPTWSPTVNGKKVNAVYDPSAQAYITSDFGSTQKVVRQRDGTLALADHKQAPSAVGLVQEQYNADLKRPKATDDMSFGQKYITGIGHGLTQIPRGFGQLTGIYSQKEIDDMKRQDADLMATGAGGLGSFTGQVAVGAALPLKVPMINNPIINRAVTGAAYGAVQPTASDESRLANTLVGSAAGVALPPMIGATGRAIKSGAEKVAPNLTRSISQGVSHGLNAIGNAKSSVVSSANARFPRTSAVLGTEVDPSAIISRLRPTQSPAPAIDAPNAPNPTNPDAVKIAKQGAEEIGFKWGDLSDDIQRRMAANADEAINLGSELTPVQLARKSILESQGFQPTRSQLTGNSEDFSIENSLRLHPEGEQLRNIDVQNNQNLERQILGMTPQGVSPLPTPQFGEAIRKGLGADKAVAENRTSNLYGTAFKKEGDILTNADDLARMLNSPKSFAVTKLDSPVRDFLKRIGKDDAFFPTANNVNARNKPKELTLDELATLRQIINSKWENVDNATQAQLNSIRGVLNKMEANPNDPAFLYNKARIGRIVQGKKWEQPLIDKIFAQEKDYPGVYRLDNKDLFDGIVKHTSKEEFAPLWARMNAQQRDLTRAQFAKEMRDEVFSNMQLNAGANRLEQGSPAKMMRFIENVGQDKIRMIYGKENTDKLMLLYRTWKELSSSPAGTKSFGSAPEIARLHRMTLNAIGDLGGKIPLVGKYINKGANMATKAAQDNAEAANRALNTNKAVDPLFDVRQRRLTALGELSSQRARDARATQNARISLPVRAGTSALREYMRNQDEQGGQ